MSRVLSSSRAKKGAGTSPVRGRSPPPFLASIVSGGGAGMFSLKGRAKAVLSAPDHAHRHGLYPGKGDDTVRIEALVVLCQGTVDFSGKRLHMEGPLAKRSRDGLDTFQFFVTEEELISLEPVSGKERYAMHHSFPLETLRVTEKAEGVDNVAMQDTAFTILNPTKSFVVVAASPAAR